MIFKNVFFILNFSPKRVSSWVWNLAKKLDELIFLNFMTVWLGFNIDQNFCFK